MTSHGSSPGPLKTAAMKRSKEREKGESCVGVRTGVPTCSEREAQGVCPILADDLHRVYHIPNGLAHLPPLPIPDLQWARISACRVGFHL